MTLTLEDVDGLAAELAAVTGEDVGDALRKALTERLERERARTEGLSPRGRAMLEIARHCAALPDLDPRTPDEIVGYDETGMWT